MMLPSCFFFLENSQSGRLLAILEKWDKASDQHTDNTKIYFMLLFIKFGLEIAVFYACNPKKYTYFLSFFGLSIVLADFLLACLMGVVWLFGAEKSLASPCFLLASASTAYGALPLPIMLLGLVDYCLEDIFMSDHSVFWKTLRNVILTLLVWVVAVNYSFHSSNVGPVELDYTTKEKVLVCEVTESTIISAFILGLFIVSLLTLVPFWSRIPQWVREIDRLLEAREQQKNTGRKLCFTSIWNPNPSTKTTKEKVLVCEVTESTIISAFILGLFIVSLLTLVPFWSRIPQWVREIDRLLEAREQQKNTGRKLCFTSIWNPNPSTKTRLDEHLEISPMRPPLWFSMMLGFLLFWMPYLVMSVSCMIFGFGLPAYLGFNLLWFECSNSLLVGLVFWAKSNTKGPYSSLPENVCLWQVYWDMSRDIQRSLLRVPVLNPSHEKKNISLNV